MLAIGSCVALGACVSGREDAGAVAPLAEPLAPPEYLGAEVITLDEGMVNIQARLRGGAGRKAVTDYADCAVSQFAREKGYGFARQVRTLVSEDEKDVWRADAVYLLSRALPEGRLILDSEAVLASCDTNAIAKV